MMPVLATRLQPKRPLGLSMSLPTRLKTWTRQRISQQGMFL